MKSSVLRRSVELTKLAARRYSEAFISDYTRLLELTAEGESVLLRRHAIQFGLIDERESHSAFAAFENMMRGGVYSILKSLEVKIDVSNYWQKMLEYTATKA